MKKASKKKNKKVTTSLDFKNVATLFLCRLMCAKKRLKFIVENYFAGCCDASSGESNTMFLLTRILTPSAISMST